MDEYSTNTRIQDDIQEIKANIARITTVIEERQHRCEDHSTRLKRTEEDIEYLRHTLSGFKAWITTAGVIGVVVGWVSNVFLHGR